MADFPGVSGKSYTVASLLFRIGGDTVRLRSVTPGGVEVAQEHVFEVGRRVAVASVTGAEKPKEITTVFDPVSFAGWFSSRSTPIGTDRVVITAVLTEPGLPSITLDYEDCASMGNEFPELKAGEATEFNVTMKWLPTTMKVNGKLFTE